MLQFDSFLKYIMLLQGQPHLQQKCYFYAAKCTAPSVFLLEPPSSSSTFPSSTMPVCSFHIALSGFQADNFFMGNKKILFWLHPHIPSAGRECQPRPLHDGGIIGECHPEAPTILIVL